MHAQVGLGSRNPDTIIDCTIPYQWTMGSIKDKECTLRAIEGIDQA